MEGVKGLNEGKKQALEVAEDAREKSWKLPSFLGDMFAGRMLWDMIFPFPEQPAEDKKIGDELLSKIETFLRVSLNPDEVDRTSKIPDSVIQGLAKLGCFGMKIPKIYGGLGLSQVNYNRAIQLISSYCGSTAVWLSAHQSIGVPQPLIVFGTEEQKKKYLPRFAKGEISAFALTEPEVGSDPAKMKTVATPIENGEAYLINGEKLWCTNGTVADIMVVMAQTTIVEKGKEKKKITAFIVEKNMPGFEVVHRCHFMGLHGIENGLLRFKNVRVPKENILWGLGQGLKLALVTLNTGRLTVPAAVGGVAKWCLHVCRNWSKEREQWGSKIGYHEAISYKLASMAANTFAMESIMLLGSNFADRKNADIRLEAAMAKLFCTERSWTIIDDTVQIRGGRGYETADSLRGRGEKALPVERVMRDMRINLIIEGTSEIMRLFIAREAMDMHLRFILPLLSPKTSIGDKLKVFAKAAFFYAGWYPRLWLTFGKPSVISQVPPLLRQHIVFVHRTSKKLARNLFHAMLWYRDSLEKKQRILFRIVNIGSDLFGIAASCARASLLYAKNSSDDTPIEMAHLLSREAERRINRQFHGLFKNDDKLGYKMAKDILDDKCVWLEEGIIRSY